MDVLEEQPKGKQDYDQWISDGIVLGKSNYQLHTGQITNFSDI